MGTPPDLASQFPPIGAERWESCAHIVHQGNGVFRKMTCHDLKTHRFEEEEHRFVTTSDGRLVEVVHRNPKIEKGEFPCPGYGNCPFATLGQVGSQETEKGPESPCCYRILGVPLSWSAKVLLARLQKLEPALDPEELERDDTPSLYPAVGGRSQTALLYLRRKSKILEKNSFFPLDTDGRREFLQIDSHFHGLTPLNVPGQDPVVDIVAVTGLAGHAYGSFVHKSTRHMWLKDFLPHYYPKISARIMTYGYDSRLKDDNSRADDLGMEDWCLYFSRELAIARRDCKDRPIIFIGHSLGGLLVKEILKESYEGQTEYDLYAHKDEISIGILSCTKAVFFFGCPHRGLRNQELKEMLKELPGGGLRIVYDLDHEKTSFLRAQNRALMRILRNKNRPKIYTFYERKRTRVVQKDPDGNWARDGEEEEMVKASSAIFGSNYETKIPVSASHTDLVKFATQNDRTYQHVLQCIEECIDELLPTKNRGIPKLLMRSQFSSNASNTSSFRTTPSPQAGLHYPVQSPQLCPQLKIGLGLRYSAPVTSASTGMVNAAGIKWNISPGTADAALRRLNAN